MALPASEVLEPPLPSRGLEKFFNKSTNSRNNSHLESLESNTSNLSIDNHRLSDNKSIDSISNSQSEDSLESNMANLSIDNVMSLDNKSIDSITNSQSEDSLDSNMAGLKINKCEDGMHCGTDDEESSQCSKIQSNDKGTAKASLNIENNELKGKY